jgi:outer membrane protein assembly factor BamB
MFSNTVRRPLWSHSFDVDPSAGSIQVAPVGSGNRVCVVEIPGPLESGGQLWCLSADDGLTLWKQPLNGTSEGLAIDAKQIVAWSSFNQLQSFDLTTGKPLWKTVLNGSHAVGAPTIASGIVFATTAAHLAALDLPTGALLWNVPLSTKPAAGPFVEGLQVILPHRDRDALHRLMDGQVLSDRPATHEWDEWPIPAGVGRAVTPKIALRQRVYFGTSNGAIVCLSHKPSE